MIDGNGSADSGLKGEAEKEIKKKSLVEQARSFERMREHSATELELRAKMKASEDAFVRDRKAWEAHRRTSPGTFTANRNLERHRAAHPWIVENEVPDRPKINLEQLNAIVDRATKGAVVKAPVYIRKIGATTEANKSAKLDRTQLQAIIKDAVQKAWAEKKVADNTPSPVSLQEVSNPCWPGRFSP